MQFWVNPIALLLWLLLFLLHWCDVIDKEREGKIEAATRLQQQQHLHSVGAVNFRSPSERSREREQQKHHTSRTDTQPHSDSKRERERKRWDSAASIKSAFTATATSAATATFGGHALKQNFSLANFVLERARWDLIWKLQRKALPKERNFVALLCSKQRTCEPIATCAVRIKLDSLLWLLLLLLWGKYLVNYLTKWKQLWVNEKMRE